MITALKSAVGTILGPNYIASGTLGLKNLDANAKLDPVVAERASIIARAGHALTETQATSFEAGQFALRALKDAEAVDVRYISEVEKNHHGTPDPEVVAHNQREVATARAAAKAADVAVTSATARSAGTRAAESKFVKHLNDLHRAGKPIRAAKPVKLPSAAFSNIVAEQREVIRALAGEQHDVERALPPVEDLVASVRSKVSRLAEAGRPRFTVSARGADIDLASSDYLLVAHGANGPVNIAQADGPALTVWLLEAELADRAEAAVREQYRPGVETLSNAERAKRLASIAERRLEAERVETQAVLAAWAQGDFSLGLRADTDPVAALNLAD